MKNLARQYTAIRFGTEADVHAFLAQVDEASRGELLKCFEFLLKASDEMTTAAFQLHGMCFVHLMRQGAQRNMFTPLARGAQHPHPVIIDVLRHVLPMVNHPKEHKELCMLLGTGAPQQRQAAVALLEQVFHPQTAEILVDATRARSFAAFDGLLELMVRVQRPELAPCAEVLIARADLKTLDEAIGIFQMPSTVGLDDATGVRLLSGLLQRPEDDVVAAALTALGALCDEGRYLELAAPAFESASFRRIQGALTGLSQFKSPRAIRMFEEKIDEGPTEIRLVVLRLLENVGDDSVLPALVSAISQDDLKAQAEAARVLRALATTSRVDISRTLMWLLRSPNVQVRRVATELISALPQDREALFKSLLAFLRDEDWWVRERVLEALVQIAGLQLTRHLAGLLNDPAAMVRRLAVQGLAQLTDPSAVGALVLTAQNDDDWWVREAAVEAVGHLEDQRAVPHILRLLEEHPELAVAAIDTFRRLKTEDAVDVVLAHLASGPTEVKLAALGYLSERTRPDLSAHVQPLAFDEDPEVGAAARRVLEAWSVRLLMPPSSSDSPESILDTYLLTLLTHDGDDLFFSAGQRVFMKRRGVMEPLTDIPLSAENVYLILQAVLSPEDTDRLGRLEDVDLSFRSRGAGVRFRVNVFQAQHGLGAVFRRINEVIPQLAHLGLPPQVASFSRLKNGLVLVGGPPGAGKSTTLTALLNDLNERDARHVITVEDPIEAVHQTKQALFTQREVGRHCPSFGSALKSMLRQDPDVILIGELRDRDTIEFALRAAETGHLVFATVHTFAADTTVDRLVNAFPGHQQDQARGMLADSLRAVLCQYLLPELSGGRVIAAELMLQTEAIAHLIRKNQTHKLASQMQIGVEEGQLTMDASLGRLYLEGHISAEDLKLRLRNKEAFEPLEEQRAKRWGALEHQAHGGPR